MSTQLSPGVQVIEKDFTQIVPTVSTSTGAIAGPFKWGPIEQPILVSNESDVLAAFGQPTNDCFRTFWLAKNFLDYSKSMYVARTDSWVARNAVSIQSGGVSKVNIPDGGAGYRIPPVITVEAPAIQGGVQAVLSANLTGGAISAVVYSNRGTGYSVGDIIEFSQPEVPQDTFDANGNVIDSVYKPARARISAVNANGEITNIEFTSMTDPSITGGAGYIDNSAITYTIVVASGESASTGSGAVLEFQTVASGIKSVQIVRAGTGYTTDQLPISITVTPNQEDNGTNFRAPVLTAEIAVGATKIKNAAHYESSFAAGQGVFGEFAAKYPGARGNGLTVSMCDVDNWSAPVFGEFWSRKTIEENEDASELVTVRRLIDTTVTFDDTQLDKGKILRTSSGKLIGEVASVDTDEYLKITLKPARTNSIPALGTHIRRHTYNSGDSTKFTITKFKRVGTSITLTLASKVVNGATVKHNFKPGDFIDVLVTGRAGSGNIVDTVVQNGVPTSTTPLQPRDEKFLVTAVTSDTITYAAYNPSWQNSSVGEEARGGYVVSTSEGYIDGFIKEYDDVNDEYGLSKRSFYVNSRSGFSTIGAGSVIKTWDGLTTLGTVESVEKVQKIMLTGTAAANDVYGETCVAEWKFKSQFGGKSPGTSAFVKSAGGSNDEVHVVVLNEAGVIVEKYEALSKASDAKNSSGKSIYYKDVINNTSSMLWVLDHPLTIEENSTKADWGSAAKNSNFKLLTNAITRTLSGGVDGDVSGASQYLNAYSLFADATSYDVSLFPIDYMAATTIKSIITDVIEKRRDCVAFVSPPLYVGNSMKIAQDIVTYRNSIGSSSFAVMNSGWKYQYDKYNDTFRWIPLCADIAGVCAYTDSIADPWLSPGGFSRGQIKNVVKLSFNPTVEQRDLLYSNSVNPVVTFPAEGTILYGDKTLQSKSSAFDRINVRRLFIVLEKSIALASKYQLFEYNDDFTRSQFRSMVEPYLRDIQGRRGITDFLVKCDTSNNTPTVIDRNEFIADIYIKPARSINFITLNFIATKTGVSFDELIS